MVDDSYDYKGDVVQSVIHGVFATRCCRRRMAMRISYTSPGTFSPAISAVLVALSSVVNAEFSASAMMFRVGMVILLSVLVE